jgi:hypothetical protein
LPLAIESTYRIPLLVAKLSSLSGRLQAIKIAYWLHIGAIFDNFTLYQKINTLKNDIRPLKTVLLALLLALVCNFAWAQEDETDGDNEATPIEKEGPKHISGGFGFFSPGFGMQDLSALNRFAGTSAFNGNGITLGGGGVLIVRSFMIGGEGGSYLARKASVGNLDMQLESGWGKFTLGYVVYGRKGLLIYPKVGIGGSTQALTLHKTNAVANVDTVFAGAYNGTSLQKKGLMMSAGLGLDWMPGFDETAGSGIVLGFDVGYNLGLTENNWTAFGTSLSSGPSVTPAGIYANLHIGFAGWNRQ